MTNRIVFIGQPEVDAKRFEARALADFPRLDLLATNDRDLALRHANEADVLMGHHFLFDEEMLRRATRLRWIQSLTAEPTASSSSLRCAPR